MTLIGANRQWGVAWICLTLALALHVADEALTGFLPLYNSVVESLRDGYGWVPLPTFEFRTWMTALLVGVAGLLALTPLVFAGRRAMAWLAYPLAGLMILNALGHVLASVYLSDFAPGVYSSPVLLAAAVFLLVATRGAVAHA